jgi:pimeloyl-ACP methyl ester carboxylesterase
MMPRLPARRPRARTGRIRYWTRGRFTLRWWEGGTGDTLLFFHGGGLPVDCFRDLCAELARHYHVISPDIPGWGRSSTPPISWSYEDYARIMRHFLRVHRVTPRHIVGYSFGGGIAAALASELPSVEHLVLVSAGVNGYRYRHGMLLLLVAVEAFEGITQAIQLGKVLQIARVGREFMLTFARHPLTQYRTFRVILRCLLSPLAMHQITAATTVISAHQDRFFRAPAGESLARQIPGASYELTPGIHLWVLLEHERAVSAILRHLRAAAPRRRAPVETT